MAKPIIFGLSDEFMRRERLGPQPSQWEDGLRADTGRGSFEWWYFDADLDDGSTAVIVYATKPLLERSGPLKPMLSLTLTRPDGVKLGAYSLVQPDAFRAAPNRCDVHMGASWVRGDLHHYQLHAEAAVSPGPGRRPTGGHLAADLTFKGIVPPWRTGTGKNYYDEACTRYFAWLPAIPYGAVEGSMTYDGQIHRVRGTGYHDHNWGNVGLNDVMSHWYWGRAHLGEYTVIFVEMVASPAFGRVKVPVFMLANGDRILTGDGQPLTLTLGENVRHRAGRSYARRLDWHWQTERGTVDLALRDPEVIEAASLLGLLPAWRRWPARWVANPYYFRFRANLELTGNLDGLAIAEHGPAIYELMLLR